MNPLSHPQMAQDTHREYDARYSKGYSETGQLSGHKVIMVLTSASVVGAIFALISLF